MLRSGGDCFADGPFLMLWTTPTIGIAICQGALVGDKREESEIVKGSRTPAGAWWCDVLGRQASEKPQGRKPRAGYARR